MIQQLEWIVSASSFVAIMIGAYHGMMNKIHIFENASKITQRFEILYGVVIGVLLIGLFLMSYIVVVNALIRYNASTLSMTNISYDLVIMQQTLSLCGVSLIGVLGNALVAMMSVKELYRKGRFVAIGGLLK